MSEEIVELVYRAQEAFNRRDLDALLALADPGIEFTPAILELEGGDSYRGHDGLRRWWEAMLTVFPDYRTEADEVRDHGDVTVTHARLRAHGTESGAFVEEAFWAVAEWRHEKCVRWRSFRTEPEALEAAGLQE
jgi:ketosteroid isomerase-like protein